MQKYFLFTFVGIFSLSLGLSAKSKYKKPMQEVLDPVLAEMNVESPPRSLTISDAYKIAYNNDPELEASRLEIEAAEHHADAETARAWGPQLGITTGMVYGKRWIEPQNQFNNTNGFTLSGGLNLIQPIFNYVNILQAEQASAAIDVSEVKNAIAQQDLIVRVTKAYLDVLRIQDFIQIKDVEIGAKKTQLEIVNEMEEVGMTSSFIKKEVVGQLAEARASKEELKLTLAKNLAVLRQVWQIEQNELRHLKPRFAFEAPSPNNPQNWIDQARLLNLNVQYHNGLLEIAQYDIEKAKAALNKPIINLVGGVSAQGTSDFPFGPNNTSTDGVTIGITATIPFYDGGYTSARTKEMASLKQRIASLVVKAQNDAAQAAEVSFAALMKSIAKIKFLQTSVSNMTEALRGKREHFLYAEVTSYEVLSTILDLNRKRQDLVAEKYEYLLNRLLLKQSVGILSVVDLEDMDGLFK